MVADQNSAEGKRSSLTLAQNRLLEEKKREKEEKIKEPSNEMSFMRGWEHLFVYGRPPGGCDSVRPFTLQSC